MHIQMQPVPSFINMELPTYSFPNLNGCIVVEVCEWISEFIPHFTMCVIT